MSTNPLPPIRYYLIVAEITDPKSLAIKNQCMKTLKKCQCRLKKGDPKVIRLYVLCELKRERLSYLVLFFFLQRDFFTTQTRDLLITNNISVTFHCAKVALKKMSMQINYISILLNKFLMIYSKKKKKKP